jgi:hypothetical protein
MSVADALPTTAILLIDCIRDCLGIGPRSGAANPPPKRHGGDRKYDQAANLPLEARSPRS